MPPLTPRTTRAPRRFVSAWSLAGWSAGLSVTLGLPEHLERRLGPLARLGGGVGFLALALALLDEGRRDLAGGDLLEGDGEGLAGDGGDLRRHDGAEALAQLGEV